MDLLEQLKLNSSFSKKFNYEKAIKEIEDELIKYSKIGYDKIRICRLDYRNVSEEEFKCIIKYFKNKKLIIEENISPNGRLDEIYISWA